MTVVGPWLILHLVIFVRDMLRHPQLLDSVSRYNGPGYGHTTSGPLSQPLQTSRALFFVSNLTPILRQSA